MTAGRRTLQNRIVMLCAWSAIVSIGGFGFAAWSIEATNLRKSAIANLETLAQMTVTNVVDSVQFDNLGEVHDFIARVVRMPDIEAVVVRDERGDVLASAVRGDREPGAPRIELPPADIDSGPWRNGFVGHVDMPYHAPVGQAATLDEAAQAVRHGSVTVQQSAQSTQSRLGQSLLAFALLGVVAITGLLLILRPLLRRLFRPVLQLLDATQTVRRTRDYGLRVPVGTDDEVGDLVRSYNAMLEAIQQRDMQLAQNAQHLEHEVNARTLELSQALSQAEQAMRAKSTFLANMSHEIRTPLNAVLGMTDLAMETQNPVEQAEYLGIVRSAGNNLLAVLNDILDFSKIESGKLEIVPVTAELETVVMEAIRPLTSKLQSKELDLFLVTGPRVASAHEFDDVRVRQIVTNLVGNAIKFTERGHVLVRLDVVDAHGEEDLVEISVSDTGVGIQPDRLDAIFSPFTQADNTITRRFSGTGLGLTICNHLARLMGGSISVQSQFGVGTTFRVQLPMRRRPLDTAQPLPSLTGRALFVHTAREPLRESLCNIAARLGTAVQSSGNWHELALRLDAMAGDERAVLVLDERDPDVDELVASRLQPHRNGRRPVLLLTSYQDLSATMQRCTDRAYAGYLLKPLGTRDFALQATSMGAERAPRTARTIDPTMRSLRILVAEDNLVNQRLIQKLLERDGHTPTLVGNGRTCVDTYSRQSFDLVLMDMQMPEMDGLQATTRIRELEAGRGQRVPIVALTANASSEDRLACLSSGMDDVLTKPVSVPKLQAALRRFVGAAAPTSTPTPSAPATTDHRGAES